MAEKAALLRLGDTDLTLADSAEDIRGSKVLDRAGEGLGEILSYAYPPFQLSMLAEARSAAL